MFDDWIKSNVSIKDTKVNIKLTDKSGKYKKSVNIPTAYYPLNGSKFEVFQKKNCTIVFDEKILKVFDSIQYKIGHCYTNADLLTTALKEAGFNAKQYCGWLFLNGNEEPTFHSWVVLGKSLLDLADDYNIVYGTNAEVWRDTKDKTEFMEKLADFYKTIQENNISNAIRCQPVGLPTKGILYVGAECDAKTGIMIWNELLRKYPEHPSYNKGDELGTETQKYLYKSL